MNVEKSDFLNKVKNLLNDTWKFKKLDLKNDRTWNFAANQEKHVDNIFKKFIASNNISEETRIFLKPVGTKPGTMYGLYKDHKDIFNSCSLF